MNDENIIRMDMGQSIGTEHDSGRPIVCMGIESSCDETSAAIVDSHKNILSHIIYSQIPEHQKYGGVVPELAARAHILAIDDVIRRTLDAANMKISDVDVIAATAGPGLIGGVLVGWMAAVGIAQSMGKPLIAVNHLEGHALVPRLRASAASGADVAVDVRLTKLPRCWAWDIPADQSLINGPQWVIRMHLIFHDHCVINQDAIFRSVELKRPRERSWGGRRCPVLTSL